MGKDKGKSTDVDDVAVVEPPLPLELELPDYHGRKAVGMKTKLTGAGNRVSRPHEIGEKFVLVLEVRAKGDGHEETDDGILYVQTAKVLDLFEIPGEPGLRLISTLRQAHRLAEDSGNGREPFEGLGTAGVTDAAGTVLTPTELAELRGDPVRSMLDDATTPVVVLYSDGARELWPDDFDTEAVRPVAGERFRTDGDGPIAYVYVSKLLDVSTGETLSEWTDEQEEARLLELEQTAETEEARAESKLEDGLEPLGTESLAPLPGEELDDDEGATIHQFPDGGKQLAEELGEPDADDFAFVDRNLDDVLGELPMILELGKARRLLIAENRGRGRNLKVRKGAVEAIERRVAELEKAQ